MDFLTGAFFGAFIALIIFALCTVARDKSEQRLLFRMPCKLGTKVWCTYNDNRYLEDHEVVGFAVKDKKVFIIVEVDKNGLHMMRTLGEDAFFTKKEAKKVLEDAIDIVRKGGVENE